MNVVSSAAQEQVEITQEEFGEGRESNHALYRAAGGDLYLASAGRDAADTRLASVLEFEPKDDSYVYTVPTSAEDETE